MRRVVTQANRFEVDDIVRLRGGNRQIGLVVSVVNRDVSREASILYRVKFASGPVNFRESQHIESELIGDSMSLTDRERFGF